MVEIKTGILQGYVCWALLFIIYMNYISIASERFKLIIYADDSTLRGILCAFNLNNDNNNNNSNMTNEELDKISEWPKLNKLSLNTTKSKCMDFHRPQKRVMYPNIEIDDVEIVSKRINFLGLYQNEQLTWKNRHNISSARLP